jgi:shikimate kinase
MNSSNVVLIGMPGAGKSTIGVLLAKSLRMPFIDTDLLIQQQEDSFLQDIINRDGIEKFLAVEEEVILKLNVEKHVIATGGSVIYSPAAMKHLKSNSTIIYLELTFEEMLTRITNIKSRGIAIGSDQSLLDLYKERTPLYEKYSDIKVYCSGKHMEEIVDEIKNSIKY